MTTIPLVSQGIQDKKIQKLSKQLGFKVRKPNDNDCYVLEFCGERLMLRNCNEPKLGAICVDFVKGVSLYRRKFGGGRKQAIAKAIGLKKRATPIVVDATAGLGQDAFVLTSLGCDVHMIERSPFIAALLADGLNRAKLDSEIGLWVTKRLSLIFDDSCKKLFRLPFKPDVVYLDPMYPEKKKAALVKKEMQVFQSLVGADTDSNILLKTALSVAEARVVVKRPITAKWLSDKEPDTSIKTKKNRFDVYITKK